MRFSPAFLDELRMRIRISEVVGRKVNLKSQGRGEFTGLCPFHKEKTPSFTVSDEKNFYHCFGCGVHGDVVRFITESQGLSFIDAVKELASRAGLELPKQTKEQEQQVEKFDHGYDLLDAACKWYEEQLILTTGSDAKSYLDKRRISQETIRTFRIGFAPGKGNGLKEAMLGLGFSEHDMVSTGLIIQKENGDSFDRFRDRVMFPIKDSKGRVVAFGGRIIGDGKPKYLNSPETYLFKKGYLLYNWDLAKQTAYDKKNIVVVEGYMDVIALYQAGIKNAVAPLGTAITANHLMQIWKIVKEPVLCMDGDNAGKRAMYRAAINHTPILKPGYSMRFASLPAGQDPDDVLNASGIEKMRDILTSASPLSEVLWELETSKQPIDTPEQKADLQQRVMQLVSSIEDKTVQNHYRKHFNNKLWEMGFGAGKKKQSVKRLTPINVSSNKEHSDKAKYETMLIRLILEYPQILKDSSTENELIDLTFSHTQYDTLRDAILEISSRNEDFLVEELEKLEFSSQIEHIRSCKFVEGVSKADKQLDVIRSEWRYLLALHNLSSTEEEYAQALMSFQNNINEETQNHIFELQKQIDTLKQAIASEKMHREALLDE